MVGLWQARPEGAVAIPGWEWTPGLKTTEGRYLENPMRGSPAEASDGTDGGHRERRRQGQEGQVFAGRRSRLQPHRRSSKVGQRCKAMATVTEGSGEPERRDADGVLTRTGVTPKESSGSGREACPA